jgi:hypothetical protein
MAVHEIRETINSGDTVLAGENGVLMVQKRINLTPGMRHTINHADFFDDGNLFGAVTSSLYNGAFEFYVTNYPLLLGDVTLPGITATDFGPQAGDDLVLFKVRKYVAGSNQTVERFPNSFLGSSPTFSFYTPYLYLTVLVANDNNEEPAEELNMSFYAALDSREVDAVEYGIGILQEYNENRARVLNSNGVLINEAEIIGGMPLWQMGGIRPEIMVSSTTGNWFLGQVTGNSSGETMETTNAIRIAVSNARNMVAHTEAFGNEPSNEPDWFKVIVRDFAGLASGPERAQFPPRQKDNNGNTLMV